MSTNPTPLPDIDNPRVGDHFQSMLTGAIWQVYGFTPDTVWLCRPELRHEIMGIGDKDLPLRFLPVDSDGYAH